MTASNFPAICHRCGGEKSGPLVPCKACSFVPKGEERPVAWLFSSHHLNATELVVAAARIRSGERPDPPYRLQEEARGNMGAKQLPRPGDAPLRTTRVIQLALANLLFTPLIGLAAWYGLRQERPSAARQALHVTLPIGLATTVAWVALLFGST